VDPAFGKSNNNHRHPPQMKIIEHLHKGTPRGMNTCWILYKSNNVLDLRLGLKLGGG